MTERNYPYTAFVVQPSGAVRQVELVKLHHKPWDAKDPEWDKTSTGKSYHLGELHPTRDAAIQAGLRAVEDQQARLTKQQERLTKRHQTLLAQSDAA